MKAVLMLSSKVLVHWLILATLVMSLRASEQRTSTFWIRASSAAKLGYGFLTGRTGARHATKPGLRVIGAGFPRTGTKSIESALLSIGHEIYDCRAALQHRHGDRWLAAAREWTETNRTQVLEELVQEIEYLGYTSTLDVPGCYFAIPLSTLRPTAKVLLSVRDSVDVWFRSFGSVFRIFVPLQICRPWKWLTPDMDFMYGVTKYMLGEGVAKNFTEENVERLFFWYEKVLEEKNGGYPNLPEAEWKQVYSLNIERVTSRIPSHQLLVFNVKQGWDPLAAFLEIPQTSHILQHPFPHINDRRTLEIGTFCLQVIALALPLWVVVSLWLGLCIVRCLNVFRLFRRAKEQKF